MTMPSALERVWFGRSLTVSSDSLVLGDGTLWSHAATLGTRFKGTEFTIDQSCVENFVKVFSSGYPQKIPVDYDHGSTTPDPDIKKLRVQGQVPKAGDVVELRGVFSADAFTGELKAAAEKLSTQAGRSLDDARNLGLWMRWKPTARALQAIKAGEYTELSIAFDDDLPHNVDGSGQGPGLWAVALLNTPFLDDMLPVAASRSTDIPPARERSASPERSSMKLTALSVAAALLGRAITSEDEALQELNNLGPQLKEFGTFREFREIVGAEFNGEKDPAKVVTAIRGVRTELKAAQDAAIESKKLGIKTTVETTIKAYESAIGTVALRAMLTRELTRELEAGVELEKTETMKTLKELSPSIRFEQSAGPDIGGAATDDDEKLDARAKELLEKDPQLKALASRDWSAAYKQASAKALRELQTKT
jgi:hypothetical protein